MNTNDELLQASIGLLEWLRSSGRTGKPRSSRVPAKLLDSLERAVESSYHGGNEQTVETKLRFVKVLRYNTWVFVNVHSLVEGDKFKLYEPDGELVRHGTGCVFIAKGKPYLNEDGVWTIVTEKSNERCEGDNEGRETR